jgi:hypothetical protein
MEVLTEGRTSKIEAAKAGSSTASNWSLRKGVPFLGFE